jgi:hypothetical protein
VQGVHSALSEEGLWEPGGHGEQYEARTPEDVPASQTAQVSVPTFPLAFPAVHSSHPTSDSRGPIPSTQLHVPQMGSVRVTVPALPKP